MLNDFWQDIITQDQTMTENLPLIIQCCEWVRSKNFHPQRIVLTGLATSLYAWETVRPEMEEAGVAIVDTGELFHYSRSLLEKAEAVFVISRSGESGEIVKLLTYLHPEQQLIAITENANSPLAKSASKTFLMNGKEQSFVNTKSFILSIAYAGAVAAGISNRSFAVLESELAKTTARIDLLIKNHQKQARQIADHLASARAILVIMRGSLIGVGRQLCLDLQEGLHIPAIPVPGSLLRHGTIELTSQKDVASLFLIQNDGAGELSMTAAEEIITYNGMVAVVCPERFDSNSLIPPVLEIGELATPIMYAIANQLIYYYLAIHKGLTKIEPQLVGKITRME